MEALEAIEKKYRPELEIAMAEVDKCDIATQPDEFCEASNKYHEIHDKIMAEREIYFKRAELRSFNKFNGNITSIVEMVKNQVLTFIYISKVFSGAMPNSIDNETIERQKEEVKQAIKHNEKLIEINPNDKELKKNTQELKELRVETLYESIYSPRNLKQRIYESFKIYLDFLLRADPIAYEELQSYIEDAIKNKDHIEIDNKKHKKKSTNKSNIITLESIIPNKHIIPNNKLSNEITKELIGIGEVALTVANKNKSNEVSTIVSINYNDEGIKLYNKANFTPYDRTVHNAVCSLYEVGNKNITPAMVYRAMNGQTGTEKISPQAIGAVTKSLDKSRTMSCKIDYTEEAKARNIPVTKTIIEDMILPAKKITVRAGGKEISAYKLHSKPIMYEYAQATKQIITVPIELLQTKSAIRSTEDVIVIREYLLRRIEIMKHSNKHSNKILYESIYKELGLNTEIRTQALADKTKKIRKAVKELLTFWKGEKYIKKYIEYKEGRIFKGINIFY